MQKSDVALFLSVIEQQSYTRAARAQGLSIATMSRNVAALEERVGVQLLARTTRRVVPTPEGIRFAARARRALEEIEDAEAEARGTALAPSGLVRVSAPPELAHIVMASALAEALATHAELSIEIELTHRKVDLVADRFDLALRLNVSDDSTLAGRKLGTFPLAAVASRAYLEANPAPSRPRQLAAHRFLSLTAKKYRDELRFVKGGRRENARVGARLFANSFELLRDLARRGVGIALMPKGLVAEDLVRGDLVRLLDGWVVPGPPLHVVYPRRRFVPAKTRTLVDRLARVPWTTW